jgi:mannose-6-phosphate isomerase-like protein (cupin superfamily)
MRPFESMRLPDKRTSIAPDGSDVRVLLGGVCLTIPLGTRFQFRSVGDSALSAIGVTMPPWPGDGEAVEVRGPWQPAVRG